jgi:hypothetical protein
MIKKYICTIAYVIVSLVFLFSKMETSAQSYALISTSTNVSNFEANDGSITALGSVSTNFAKTTIREPLALITINVDITGNFFVTCSPGNEGSLCANPTNGNPPFTYAWSNSAVGYCINNLIAGTYCVTVTDNNGDTGTACGTIIPPPSISVNCNVQSNVSCYGGFDGEVCVSVTGGSPSFYYMWSSGQSTPNSLDTFNCISNLSAGNYCVTVSDDNLCAASCCIFISEPPPLVVDIGSDTTVCETSGITLCGAGNFVSWLWSTLETDSCIFVDDSGTISLIATNSNGCEAFDTITILVDPCTGIEEYNGEFGIYPNPTDGLIMVVLPPEMRSAELTMTDVTGRFVFISVVMNRETIDISGLSKGVYFLMLDRTYQMRVLRQ